MLTAAAIVPSPPLLLPGLGGASDPLEPMREAAVSAVASLAGHRVLVVGGATKGGAHALDAPSGIGRYLGHGAAPDALPLALEVGRRLASLAGVEVTGLVAVADSASPEGCLADGAELVREVPTALLVVADGSATRTPKAPGHFDARAEDFDARLVQAIAQADADALAGLDPQLCGQLAMRGRPALQVLAGAAGHTPWSGTVTWDDAPYGVAYIVGTWRREGAPTLPGPPRPWLPA